MEALRRTAAGAKTLWHRSVHPVRRRVTESRLRDVEGSPSVLFVCHGNICRSPYAEAAFRELVGERLQVRSAGLLAGGRRPPEEALQAARSRGVDLSEHRSRSVDRPTLEITGLVVVMDPVQDRLLRRRFGRAADLVLGDLDPRGARRRAIRDPVFQDVEVFHSVYDRIDRCVEALARTLDVAPPSLWNETPSAGADG